MTFTHASLRLQPDVLELYWRSEEAWNNRVFQRVHVSERNSSGPEYLKGEYHIMYTPTLGTGLPPNQHAKGRIYGDAFIMKMASKKNEDGDWHYENISQDVTDIRHCSLRNQCLETLRSLRPIDYQAMVGERGNGPPGVLSPGTGLPGMCRPKL